MNRTILYYPTIDVPNNSWLRNAIMYWDEVSSIVPLSWDNEILSELSPDIHYLMAEGEFRPIKPETLITGQHGWNAFEQFQAEFKLVITSPQFPRKRINYTTNTPDAYRWSRIHANKTSESIVGFLQERGLAKRGSDYDHAHGWWLFEHDTALLYMSLLAKYLADADSEQTSIGTDNMLYEKFNFRKVTESRGFPVISFDLQKVLPTPKADVPLKKVLAFKRRRIDNLRHFKRIISEFQNKISHATSQTELKETAANFEETLINGVSDLRAALKDARIESGFKTLKSVIGFKSPTTWVSAATAVNGIFHLTNISLPWTMMGIAGAGAIDLTCHFIESKNKERVRLRESPFSYVYKAQKAGFFNRSYKTRPV